MNEITIKVPAKLINAVATSTISENSKTRIFLAISKLRSLASECAVICSSEDADSKFAANLIQRTGTFLNENPDVSPSESISYPAELWDVGPVNMYSIFKYSKSDQNRQKIMQVIREGESLGIWRYFECTENKGKKSSKAGFHQPKRLVFTGDWWRSETVPHVIEVTKPILNLIAKTEADNEAKVKQFLDANDSIMKAHIEFAAKCTLPTEQQLIERAKELVSQEGGFWSSENAYGNKKRYAFGVQSGCLDIREQIYRFISDDFRKLKDYQPSTTSAGQTFGSRRYTTFSMLPKWIRSEIRLGGEKIVGIDACALHPNIIGKLAAERGIMCKFLSGDSHAKIAELLGVTRSEAKVINLSYWNHRKDGFTNGKNPKRAELLKRFHEFMTENHSDVLQMLRELNSEYRFLDKYQEEVDDHARLSRILFFHESVLIGEVLKELNAKGVVADQCYDCVYVSAGSGEAAISVFDEKIKDHGLATKAA